METITPIFRWTRLIEKDVKTKYERDDVLIVNSRSGKDYFICPQCKTKNYFVRNQVVEMLCPKCELFGVQNSNKFWRQNYPYLYK